MTKRNVPMPPHAAVKQPSALAIKPVNAAANKRANNHAVIPILLLAAALGGAASIAARRPPKGNSAVPQPAKPVDLARYTGRWYEIARYENSFERGCEGATADYTQRPDGQIGVVNSCRDRSNPNRTRSVSGRAKIVPGSGNAKLKVSFFGPFFGNYWVLDHDDDYQWSIVGEPSGRYLWILHRESYPGEATRMMLIARAKQLGYNTSLIRRNRAF